MEAYCHPFNSPEIISSISTSTSSDAIPRGSVCNMTFDKDYYLFILSITFRYLKALDTFGNCQRTVFSLGVFLHMHKITNLWKFPPKLQLQENNEGKTIVLHKFVWFHVPNKSLLIFEWEITFSKTKALTIILSNYQ